MHTALCSVVALQQIAELIDDYQLIVVLASAGDCFISIKTFDDAIASLSFDFGRRWFHHDIRPDFQFDCLDPQSRSTLLVYSSRDMTNNWPIHFQHSGLLLCYYLHLDPQLHITSLVHSDRDLSRKWSIHSHQLRGLLLCNCLHIAPQLHITLLVRPQLHSTSLFWLFHYYSAPTTVQNMFGNFFKALSFFNQDLTSLCEGDVKMFELDAMPSSSTMNRLDVSPSCGEYQEGRMSIVGRSFDVSFDSRQKFDRNRAFHSEKGLIATEMKMTKEQKHRRVRLKPIKSKSKPSSKWTWHVSDKIFSLVWIWSTYLSVGIWYWIFDNQHFSSTSSLRANNFIQQENSSIVDWKQKTDFVSRGSVRLLSQIRVIKLYHLRFRGSVRILAHKISQQMQFMQFAF